MDADRIEELAAEIRRTAGSSAKRNRWFHAEGCWGISAAEGRVYVIGPPEFGSNLCLTDWDLLPVSRIVAEAVVTGDVAGCRSRLTGPPQKRSDAKPKRKRAPRAKDATGGE
jgi:hypothetical protein